MVHKPFELPPRCFTRRLALLRAPAGSRGPASPGPVAIPRQDGVALTKHIGQSKTDSSTYEPCCLILIYLRLRLDHSLFNEVRLRRWRLRAYGYGGLEHMAELSVCPDQSFQS